MAESLSGEEKLRIVLESIIRSVPKEEQCQKYNVSEDDFEAWREHLMTKGGKIFEPDYVTETLEPTSSSGTGLFIKIILTLSILGNLAILGWAVVWKLDGGSSDHAPELTGSLSDSPPSLEVSLEKNPLFELASTEPTLPLPSSLKAPEDSLNLPIDAAQSSGELEALLLASETPSTLDVTSPPSMPGMTRPTFEINAFGVRTRGRQVVFALDVSDYMTRGSRTQSKFIELKKQLMSAISDLSVNSHFNLILFRNLREVEMLGRTVLLANPKNKGLALKWLKDIGEPWEKKEEIRNRHYNERDIVDKPPKGAVGPWYALYCAINSYKPDAVFVLTGDCSSMRAEDFSVVDWTDLDVAQGDRSAAWDEWTEKTKTLRLTAVKWLQAAKKEGELLPTSSSEMVALALGKLQLSLPPNPRGSRDSSWPWREVYEKFLSGLRTETTPLPIVHFVVTLPDGVTWSEELSETVREFATGVEGKLTFYEPTIP